MSGQLALAVERERWSPAAVWETLPPERQRRGGGAAGAAAGAAGGGRAR